MLITLRFWKEGPGAKSQNNLMSFSSIIWIVTQRRVVSQTQTTPVKEIRYAYSIHISLYCSYFLSLLYFFSCRAPPTALLPKARYERIIEAFGGKGFCAETPDELSTALKNAFDETRKNKKPVLINVMISPYADRKPQVPLHLWHTIPL